MIEMPKKMKDDKVSIRLDLEGKDFREFKYLSDYYGVTIAKELVRFIIKNEYRKIREKEDKFIE